MEKTEWYNRWFPRQGDLVKYHADSKLYHILEVVRTPYGFSKFVAIADGEIKLLSTLNCDPVEHLVDYDYDNSSTLNSFLGFHRT